eukprot:9502653-Pyramimonas_sp.AAC.1
MRRSKALREHGVLRAKTTRNATERMREKYEICCGIGDEFVSIVPSTRMIKERQRSKVLISRGRWRTPRQHRTHLCGTATGADGDKGDSSMLTLPGQEFEV